MVSSNSSGSSTSWRGVISTLLRVAGSWRRSNIRRDEVTSPDGYNRDAAGCTEQESRNIRILTHGVLRLMRMSEKWKATDIPSLTGKRVVITGGNSGIGYHAALKLGRKGAQVVLACRDRRRGEEAVSRLHADSPGRHLELAILDLASLSSVREFAEKELAQRRPLDILINNAGVMAPPRRLQTAEGFELQFGTN